jgi:hypothetical protein
MARGIVGWPKIRLIEAVCAIRTSIVLIVWLQPPGRLFAKKIVQGRLRPLDRCGVLGDVGPSLRLKVIAEIRLVFLANFFCGRLLAVLRVRGVVLDAHLAHVEFGVARLANVEATQRETQGG